MDKIRGVGTSSINWVLMMSSMFTHGIRFEVAQDVLGVLFAHWAKAAAKARDAANPDTDHLNTPRAIVNINNTPVWC